MLVQEQISQDYMDLSREEMDRKIREAKEALGSSLLILGHHYQQPVPGLQVDKQSCPPHIHCKRLQKLWWD